MKVGIMQPYFLPYIGYFQLIKLVDKYVIFDDVNYINRGWINRNNILINGEKKLFTIKLRGASQNKLINEIEIEDDFQKLLKTLKYNYSKAPFYPQVYELLLNITSFENKCLSIFNTNSIKEIMKYLGITTEIVNSSQIPKNDLFKGQEKIIELCKTLGASTYINAIGGQKLYSQKYFQEAGISLNFIKSIETNYNQFSNVFIPWLSIIDILMFNSKNDVNYLLNRYEIV